MPDDVNVCDFGAGCERPRWRYGCGNFTLRVAGHTHTSVGPWFACDACAAAVDTGDWHKMIDRVFQTGNMQRLDPLVRQALIKWYAAFWRNRDGTRTAITDRDRADAAALRAELIEEEPREAP